MTSCCTGDLFSTSKSEVYENLNFSPLFQKNGTVRDRLEVKRGMEDIRDLGKLVEFKDQKVQTVWDGEECNKLRGTDSTIFPPFLTKKDKIEGFLPDLCRCVQSSIVQHRSLTWNTFANQHLT